MPVETTERSSKLSIVNNALALLQKHLADDLPESYEEAGQHFERDIARLYDDTYDETLASRPWRAASKRLAIVAVEGDQLPTGSGGALFRKPSDCLRLNKVYAGQAPIDATSWQQLGEFIEVRCAVGMTIVLDYVYRIVENDLLSAPLLRAAISARLAWRCARFLTDSRTTQQQMEQLAEKALLEAWNADAAQGGSRIAMRSRTLDAMSGADDAGYRRHEQYR